MPKTATAAAFCLLPVTLCAQWLNFKQPGIPRRPDGKPDLTAPAPRVPDGKPDLTAPAPRVPDGKPDLSGLWGGGSPFPGPVQYMGNVISDIQDEAIFRPAAEALVQKRQEDLGRDWPAYHCLPIGPVQGLVETYRIIQSPTVVALLFSNDYSGDDYRTFRGTMPGR
jgi:hypothetical protein